MKQEQKISKAPLLIRKLAPVRMEFPVKLGATITFSGGIPGFEKVETYRFRAEDGLRPFVFLDSKDDSSLSFVCIDTFFVYPTYEINLSSDLARDLGIKSISDAAVFSIVTVGESVKDTTANLMSPLLINLNTLRGTQVILENSNYPVRFNIWDSVSSNIKETSKVG